MIYRDFKGEKLSAMAMGCMRLPVVDGDDNVIDEPAAREMFDYAFENGVNSILPGATTAAIPNWW